MKRWLLLLFVAVAMIQEYNEQNDKELWLVNEIGYQHLFGDKGSRDIYFTNVLMLLVSVIICFSFFKRKTSEDCYLQDSCVNGREKRFYMQLKTAITIVILFSLICFLAHLWYVVTSYGLSTWQAPIQSISGYEELVFPGSIALFYIVQILKKMVNLFGRQKANNAVFLKSR